MALGSQASREGVGHRITASGGGQRGPWRRWVGLLAGLVLVIGGGWWLLATLGGPEPVNGAAGDDSRLASADDGAGSGETDAGADDSRPTPSTHAGGDAPNRAAADNTAIGSAGGTDNGGAPDSANTDNPPATKEPGPAAFERLVLAGDPPLAGGDAPGNAASGGPGGSNAAHGPAAGARDEDEGSPGGGAGRQLAARYDRRGGDEAIARGMDLIASGQPIQGRRVLSGVLFDSGRDLADRQAKAIRRTLTRVNKEMIFSPAVNPNDSLATTYRVRSGDRLIRIGRRFKVPYPFLERINGIKARNLRVGQTIKVVRGPVHVRIDKSRFVMDLYLHDSDGRRIYIKSYPVGLGEANSTPPGQWRVTEGRKVKNPDWRNPRTGKYYKSDDPKNPIGEYWIALTGVGPNTKNKQGYGIHGTIEPDSIGRQMSMGCVRLRPEHIQRVFTTLMAGESTVQIVK